MVKNIITQSDIASKIYIIRGQKMMVDMDLAVLYGVQTKRLKEQVNRNINRFPNDFMFILNKKEFNILRSQFATSNRGGVRYYPMAFTEQGIAMLSSVLNSNRAIQVNIQIMRTFIKIKEWLLTNSNLKLLIKKLEQRIDHHDTNINNIKEEIKTITVLIHQLLNPEKPKKEYKIGFRTD